MTAPEAGGAVAIEPAGSLDEFLEKYTPTPQPPAQGASQTLEQMAPAAPQAPAPSATLDDFLATHGNYSGLGADMGWGGVPYEYAINGPGARILKAFAVGVKGAIGSGESSTAQQMESAVSSTAARAQQDADAEIQRSFIGAIAYPAASAVNAAITGADVIARGIIRDVDVGQRAVGAVASGVTSAIAQAGKETGTPSGQRLGDTLAGMVQYEMQRGDILAAPTEMGLGEGVSREAEAPAVSTPRDDLIDQSQNLVIGQSPDEATYFGLAEPKPDNMIPPETTPPTAPAPAAAQIAPDIHAMARQIAPEVFGGPKGYDALVAQQNTLRGWLADLQANRDAGVTSSIDGQIADLQNRIADTTPRLAKKYASRIDDLQAARQQALDQVQSAGDTADMAQVRRALIKTDYAMRDLAPDVSAAYRQAEAQMPDALGQAIGQDEAPGAIAPEEAQGMAPEAASASGAETQEPDSGSSSMPAPLEAAATNAESQPAEPALNDSAAQGIAADVAQKLMAAGRPADEAQAAGAIVAAHYEARAARFNGAKGSASDIYQAEAPAIEGAARGRKGELGRTVVNQGRNTIRLMRNADASTFVHETGHQWLEELMGDANDAQAPADLVQDAQTVRGWLDAQEGADITRAQHEKFARGFERYLMEGRAPSAGLAGVFGQFKGWLTSIYQRVARLRAPINDDIRDVFGRLISVQNGRTVIAPDAEGVQATRAADIAGAAIPEPGPGPRGDYVDTNKLPPPPSDVLDKAGNIRLDNINAPDDIDEVLREGAKENNDFIAARRGRISAAQQLELADDLGMTPEELNFRRIGQAFNAEQIIAARKLLRQSAAAVRDAMVKFDKSGTDADGLAYATVRARHMMIQEHVAGITAEAGRALGAFRKLAGDGDIRAVAQVLQQSEGKTLFQLRQEAHYGATLDTPQAVSRWVHASRQAGFGRMLLEYYINNLLSGPITHARYLTGNVLTALWRAGVETPMAAAVGKIQEMRGVEGVDRVRLAEAKAQLSGMVRGAQRGWIAAGTAWKRGITVPLPGETVAERFLTPETAIPGRIGEIVRTPSRAISAIHTLQRFVGYEQEIAARAARQALKEGLTGQAYIDRVSDLTENPSEEVMGQARDVSISQAYMRQPDYNSAFGLINRAINSSLPLKFLVPFMRVGGNITRGAFLERSPLGLLSTEIRDDVLGKNGAAAQQMAIGKMVAGTALIASTAGLAAEGLMTGGGPTDPNAYREWIRAGNRPYSLHVGNFWVSYDHLGSLSMLMKLAADTYANAAALNDGNLNQIAASWFEALSQDVLDENWMVGVHNALDAVFHWREYGPRYLDQLASNFMPFSVGLSQMQREIDPYRAQVLSGAWALVNEARAKIPFVSRGMYPEIGWDGAPIENLGQITMTQGPDQTDLALERLEAMGYPVAPVRLRPQIRGVQLTDRQYYDYARTAGTLLKRRLDAFVDSRGFQVMTPYQQATTIRNIVDTSREAARSVIMMQNPSIGRAANRAKEAAVAGDPEPRGTIEQ